MSEFEQVTDPTEKDRAWEDLGRPEEPTIQCAFTIILHESGAMSTQIVEQGVQRLATTYDVYKACQEIVSDIESLMLADRVTKSVLAALTANPSDEAKERLRSALSERGIDTSKA